MAGYQLRKTHTAPTYRKRKQTARSAQHRVKSRQRHVSTNIQLLPPVINTLFRPLVIVTLARCLVHAVVMKWDALYLPLAAIAMF